MLFFRIFLIIFLHASPLLCLESIPTGTIIVTYQTGPKGERLERVHFWLKREGHHDQFFPKGNAFLDDPDQLSRMVVIEHLPPGEYTIEFAIPNNDNLFETVPKRIVNVFPSKIAKIDQVIKPKYATLKALASFEDDNEKMPIITLKDNLRQIRAQTTVGKMVVRHLHPGKYQLNFEKADGYNTPDPIEISLGPNEVLGPVERIYTKIDQKIAQAEPPPFPMLSLEKSADIQQKTVLVPSGSLILGDPFDDLTDNERLARTIKLSKFHIGMYLVTNSQYAEWLNKALKEKKVIYQTEGEHKGVIIDQEGNLLCKTKEADENSQILVDENFGKILFLPAIGKHNHPVIHVSWYGAEAFCKDNQFRLPTEAEWEKAAGMAKTSLGQPLLKYKYGFSKNDIDKTWANYKDRDYPSEKFQVRTTRVGFYNGNNQISNNEDVEKTNLAVSPVGAFDMSGNVWEWVSDWFDSGYPKHLNSSNLQGPSSGIDKVAKGGCYDSLPDGVRVAERIALLPYHTDPYTGFRVASDN